MASNGGVESIANADVYLYPLEGSNRLGGHSRQVVLWFLIKSLEAELFLFINCGPGYRHVLLKLCRPFHKEHEIEVYISWCKSWRGVVRLGPWNALMAGRFRFL